MKLDVVAMGSGVRPMSEGSVMSGGKVAGRLQTAAANLDKASQAVSQEVKRSQDRIAPSGRIDVKA